MYKVLEFLSLGNWFPFAGSRGAISASGATGPPEAEAICSREMHEGLLGDIR